MVPDLQISKKVDLLMIYMFFLTCLLFFHCFDTSDVPMRLPELRLFFVRIRKTISTIWEWTRTFK